MVQPDDVGAEQPTHPGHQIGLGCLHHQVEVVGNQAQGVNLPRGLEARVAQRRHKPVPIRVVAEDHLSVVPPIHQVVHRSRIPHSERASHKGD